MSSKPAAAAAAATATTAAAPHTAPEIGEKRKHDNYEDDNGRVKSKREKTDKYPKARVVNWNVLASEYTKYNLDGKTNETIAQRNARWVHQVKFLLEHADIATLQEVTTDWIAYAFKGVFDVDTTTTTSDLELDLAFAGALNKVFDYHFVKREYLPGAVLKPDQRPKNDGCAILLRRGMFAPLTGSIPGQQIVSERGGGNFSAQASVSLLDPRCCAIVHVRGLDGKEIVTIASVHLEGKRDPDGKTQYTDIRTAQLKEVREMMLKVSRTSTPRLMVVAGDFNQEWNYGQIKDAFGKDMSWMNVHVTNLSQERPESLPGCSGVPDFEFEAAELDPPKVDGYAAIEPADEYTSVFGAIDQVLMMSSVKRAQPGRMGMGMTEFTKSLTSHRVVVLPEPKDRVKRADGKSAVGGNGAKPSPYANSPYDDGGKWSSDHWALLFKILLA